MEEWFGWAVFQVSVNILVFFIWSFIILETIPIKEFEPDPEVWNEVRNLFALKLNWQAHERVERVLRGVNFKNFFCHKNSCV